MATQNFHEYERIVEFSYHVKQERFTIRFLDGSFYILSIKDLPKKLQTRKPDWEGAELSHDQSRLLVLAGEEVRQIPAHLIHSRGKSI